jgi:uncharacterized membrane protein
VDNQITETIIVQGKAADLYELWADFENFPKFVTRIKSVEKTGEHSSHWVMEGPSGMSIEWDAETTRLERNKRIAWSSTGGDIKTSGQVTFNPLPQHETEVTVTLHYVLPNHPDQSAIAELFKDVKEDLQRDLRNFKAYAEGMFDRIV